ncbi:E3 ubiquitin-protein ligase PUB23-like [Diospyros lotus]|uniref:E3 ubiquitin-protein ligase PUB23-like n=1 Tax=Diospyros lotus TaxID=55363 RepID=UPI0022574A95|nr:E3 ubiquitin-protein ligase PUB23-like [Diospyros lotus]
MEEIEVPSHFLCPISLQLMRDPVTVSSGITYDRESIERWLFSCKSNTCPVTKQSLSDSTDLIPNHALRRLIQAWCTLNVSHGIERIPTPKQPLDRTQITKLLDQAKKSPQKHPQCLQKLRSIAYLSQRNRKCLEDAGAVEFLASIINKNEASTVEADEALCLLYLLEISEASRKKLASNNIEFVESLMNVLNCGNYQSRAYSVMLMKSILEVANPSQLTGVRAELFNGVVHVLNDKISHQATKAALKLLGEVCPWGRNRIKAVEAGAVSALVELLLETVERRYSELILVVLDQLCRCAEGRAELLKHGAGLAVVSKKILRVSHVGTDRAVRILSGISRFSGSPRVVQEMLQVGVVSKLCLVLQVETSGKTKERTNEMLKLHSRVWKNSACIPPHLLSSYPN